MPDVNRLMSLTFAALLLTNLAGCGHSVAGSSTIVAPAGPFTPAGESHRLPRTLAGALGILAPEARREFEPACRAARIAWPPAQITLLAFKQEKVLEAWGANPSGRFAFIARFPILAASGTAGPKRREGDMQVPEGIYRIDMLNPASRFHLSMRVAYPNVEDVANATVPRSRMGGDIYVHGNAVSAGCIAIGDAAIERVFALVALARPSGRRIILSPVDFRSGASTAEPAQPWVREIYARIRSALRDFRQ